MKLMVFKGDLGASGIYSSSLRGLYVVDNPSGRICETSGSSIDFLVVQTLTFYFF